MSFAAPLWLIAAVGVPLALLVAASAAGRRRMRYAVRFPAFASVEQAVAEAPSWQRRLPAAFVLAALAALAVALARPHLAYSAPAGEASIMLVLDHSGSMASTDVQPSRLVAAERAADTFIGELPSSFRVGAIGFSTSPDLVQDPVLNHGAARALIGQQTANGSTATGDALALALQLLHGSDPKHAPAAIVLLSDGAANAGQNPVTIAQQAAHDKIAIYTVALGTPDGTLPAGPFGSSVPVPPDPQLMGQIAHASGGRAFDAQTADELSSIYKHLGNRLGSVKRTHEITAEFAAGGLVLLLLAAVGSARWGGRLP